MFHKKFFHIQNIGLLHNKKNLLIFALCVIGSLAIGFVLFSKHPSSQASLLTYCISAHQPGSKGHYHAKISITQDNEPITIPARIGIVKQCIHPIHTHDTSGIIHIDYPTYKEFNLGDFFDMMGYVFDDQQIGSIKKSDRYSFKILVNGREARANYRNVTIHKDDSIQLLISSK